MDSGLSCKLMSKRADLATWLVVISLLGYPILGTLVAFTSLSTLFGSFPVRALVLILSFRLIHNSTHDVWKVTGYRVVAIFWGLYFIRLIWDAFVPQIFVADEFMFKFIFFSVIPSFALMHISQLDENKLGYRLLILGIVGCALAVIAGNTDFAGVRSFTDLNEGRLFLETVNPITYGHVGVTTILAAVAVFQYSKGWFWRWLVLILAVGLGLYTIHLAGSRGPVVSLLFCMIALAVFNRRYRWIIFSLVGMVALLLIGISGQADSLVVSRLTYTVQSDESEIRAVMQAGAMQQFIDSPIVGSAILEKNFEDFPHNPIVESAMAVGVPGLLLFLMLCLWTLGGIRRLFRDGMLALPLITTQYIMAAMFSGSIAESTSMWLFIVLMIGVRTMSKDACNRFKTIKKARIGSA